MATGQTTAKLPQGVEAQLPAGYGVMLSAEGPLLGDGRKSLLVVADPPVDTRDNPSPRPLLIFESAPNGLFKLVARNDHVVFRADEGGQCDPFEDGVDGLAVKGLYFTVQNAVACGDHWSDFITFRYDPSRRQWLFHNEVVTFSFPVNGKPDETHVTRESKTKPVSFEAWEKER